MSDWETHDEVTCVSCPECAFTFDAFHRNDSDDEYSCPNCTQVTLEAVLLTGQRLVIERALIVSGKVPNTDAFWLYFEDEFTPALTAALTLQNPKESDG